MKWRLWTHAVMFSCLTSLMSCSLHHVFVPLFQCAFSHFAHALKRISWKWYLISPFTHLPHLCIGRAQTLKKHTILEERIRHIHTGAGPSASARSALGSLHDFIFLWPSLLSQSLLWSLPWYIHTWNEASSNKQRPFLLPHTRNLVKVLIKAKTQHFEWSS